MGSERTAVEQDTRRSTLSDVAARAGVSLSTASLVYSGNKPVSDVTRAKVQDAAAALGYGGPDPVAASLRRGRSGVVGFMVGDRLIDAFRDPVIIATLDGLSQALDEAGTGLMLLQGGPGMDPPVGARAARLPLDAVVFGWCGADDDPSVDVLRARGVPMVGIEGPHAPDVPLVDVEHRAGSRRLAEHLRDLGHRDVAVLTLPFDPEHREGPVGPERERTGRFLDARERLAGVRDVLGPDVRVWETERHLVDDGRRAAHALLTDRSTAPTAVVAQSDLLAAGVVLAAADLGWRVPDDLSVVGFDGIDTPWLGLELTTAVQPMVDKGLLAGRMVGAVLAGERPADVVLPVEVRIGETTAPPRG